MNINKTELGVARKLLHLSINQIADFIGVQSRSLRRWEDGTHPVPDFIAKQMSHWLDVYSKSISELSKQIETMQKTHGDDFVIALMIYSNQEDWELEQADGEYPYQLFNAVNTNVWLNHRHHSRLVAFDFNAYSDWLDELGYADSRQFRIQWAALQPSS